MSSELHCQACQAKWRGRFARHNH